MPAAAADAQIISAAAFSSADFNAKDWVNTALREGAAAADEPLELRLSVLLTKLQLAAADVDADVHRWCVELSGVASTVSRELGLVHEQAGAVRGELTMLLEEVASLEQRSEASVGTLREALRVRDRIEAVAQILQQAERISALMHSAETAFTRGDAASAAGSVAQLGGALDLLGPSERHELFPDATRRVPAIKAQVLDKLKPELLQAVREHDVSAMQRLATVFAELGASDTVRDTYVQCAQGPIFEKWNAAKREPFAADALSTLWRCLEAIVPVERKWVSSVFPSDDALLLDLLGDALEAINPQVRACASHFVPSLMDPLSHLMDPAFPSL